MPESLTHARLRCKDSNKLSLDLPINPTSIKLKRRLNWADQGIHGQPWGTLQFAHGQSDVMETTILIDESESDRSVLPTLRKLYALTLPLQIDEEGSSRPACVFFDWEDLQFQGVIQNLEYDILRFDAEGRPKRATVKLELLGKAFVEARHPKNFFGQTYEAPKLAQASKLTRGDDLRLQDLE